MRGWRIAIESVTRMLMMIRKSSRGVSQSEELGETEPKVGKSSEEPAVSLEEFESSMSNLYKGFVKKKKNSI